MMPDRSPWELHPNCFALTTSKTSPSPTASYNSNTYQNTSVNYIPKCHLGLPGSNRLLQVPHSLLNCLVWVGISIQWENVIVIFNRQGEASMCVLSIWWTFNWVSLLLVLVCGRYISHGILHEESTSYRWHAEQIPMLCSQPAFRGDYISSTARTRMALGRAHTSATQCLIHKNISGPIFFEISCYRVLYSFWPFHSMVKNHFYKLNNFRIKIQIRIRIW